MEEERITEQPESTDERIITFDTGGDWKGYLKGETWGGGDLRGLGSQSLSKR